MKRIISCLLTVALLLTLAMPVAMAADEKVSGAFAYRLKGNGTAVITKYYWANHDYDIYIPRMLDGHTVTEIGEDAFTRWSVGGDYPSVGGQYGYHLVGSLVIPDTITSIGSRAFMGIELRSVSITIPDSVGYIGAGAFAGISNLEQIIVDSNNQTYASIDGVLYNKRNKELLAYPSAKRVAPLNGEDCEWIVEVPNGIVSIGDYAFLRYNNDKRSPGPSYKWIPSKEVAYVKLPETLTHIGDYAFSEAKVVFSPDVSNGKSHCYDMVLPSNLTSIGKGAFYAAFPTLDVNGFETGVLDISNTNLTSISELAFAYTRAETINFPSYLETIEERAFIETKVRSGFVLPASITEIQDGAFSESVIGTLSFAENSSLKHIGNQAFFRAQIGSTISIPAKTESIGDEAFYWDIITDEDKLKEISLPEGVTQLGDKFCSRRKVRLKVVPGSYAAFWASENGYIIQSDAEEDTSWLNN